MLSIEYFGYKAEEYNFERAIKDFFEKFDPKLNVLFIAYPIVPKNKDGENVKIVKLIASSKLEVKRLRHSEFLKLDCLKDANVGLFHYQVVKQADVVSK
jgi:hypothetical protein